MSSARNPSSQRGAHALGDPKRRKGGWLKWLLLALLLLALVIGLIALLTGGDDDPSKASKSPSTATAPATAPAAAVAPADTTAAAAPSSSTSAASGSLTAGGTDLLPVADPDLASKIDQDATGSGVTVQSVTDGGFFVGTSTTDRRYVEYGGDVGADEPDQTYVPKVGDVVDLTGPVKKAPKSAGTTLKLNPADAKLVSDQGAYINADTVKAAA